MNKKWKATLISSSVLLLAACGGGSSSSSGASSNSGYTLTAIDGYLYKAEVCVDENQNNKCDTDELVIGSTNESGQFSVPSSNKDDKLVIRVVAGETIDQDDGLPIANGYSLAAPTGTETITPFTHLAVTQNKTLEEVATDLGLSVDSISGDYIAAKEGGAANQAKQAHKVAQFIAEQLQQDAPVDTALINKAIALKEEIDNILANNPDADVDDFVIVVDSNGDASSSEIPSLNYLFSETTTYFQVWLDIENDCGLGLNKWVVEKVEYDPALSNYSLTNCAGSAGATFNVSEIGSYTVDGTFLTWTTYADESFNRFDYLPSYNAFKTCFVRSEDPADAPATCPDGYESYETVEQADAQALLDALNALQAASELKITVNWTETLTAYTQGSAFTNGNSSMQCDLNENRQVGDVETATVELVRDGDTVTATVVGADNLAEEEDLGDSWTYSYNIGSQTLTASETGTSVDPTGQQDDIFSSDYEIEESYQWNANSSTFVGTMIDNSDLSWTVDSSVSSCDRTFSVVMTPTSSQSKVSAFLGL